MHRKRGQTDGASVMHGIVRNIAVASSTAMLLLTLIGCDLASGPRTPTPAVAAPAAMPTLAPGTREGPPRGPGVQPGIGYPYTLFIHCGVRDAIFDGRLWQAQKVPKEWTLNPPEGWTREDSTGSMTLVSADVAVFKSNSGRSIEFRPWPAQVPWGPCA